VRPPCGRGCTVNDLSSGTFDPAVRLSDIVHADDGIVGLGAGIRRWQHLRVSKLDHLGENRDGNLFRA